MDQKHACEMDLCILPECRVWTQGGGRWEGRGSGEYGIVWRLQLGSARACDAKRRSLESHRGQVLKYGQDMIRLAFFKRAFSFGAAVCRTLTVFLSSVPEEI